MFSRFEVGRSQLLKIFFLTAAIGAILIACLVGFYVLDYLYLRHERAAARWQAREPHHYIYSIKIIGVSFASHLEIEIQDKRIVRSTHLETGSPSTMWQMSPGSSLHQSGLFNNYILIDSVFELIQASRKPSSKPLAIFYQLEPVLYTSLVRKGFVSEKTIPCTPPFPRATYNPEFGYPEKLILGARRCSISYEERSEILIEIDSFQILP